MGAAVGVRRGFEQDAATEVCSDPRLPAGRIVAVLGALVDKSILKRQLKDTGTARYWLLETLRQYGAPARAWRRGHHTEAALRLDLRARQADRSLDSRQAEMFNRMSAERDNLWTALDFCLQHPAEVEAAAELAQHLMAYWASRGPFSDVGRVLTSLAGWLRRTLLPGRGCSGWRLSWPPARTTTTPAPR